MMEKEERKCRGRVKRTLSSVKIVGTTSTVMNGDRQKLVATQWQRLNEIVVDAAGNVPHAKLFLPHTAL